MSSNNGVMVVNMMSVMSVECVNGDVWLLGERVVFGDKVFMVGFCGGN